MKQLFGIDKEKIENIDDGRPVLSSDILRALEPIESEKKEERCTKCDGSGIVEEKMSSTAGDNACTYCNGSGKEPRKEDSITKDCQRCRGKKWEDLEANLSRYKEALEMIVKISPWGNFQSESAKIASTALAEESSQEFSPTPKQHHIDKQALKLVLDFVKKWDAHAKIYEDNYLQLAEAAQLLKKSL